MIGKSPRFGLTPREHRISALPSTLGSIIVLSITMFNGTVLWPESRFSSILLLGAGLLGILYLILLDLIILPSPEYKQAFGWINAALTSTGLLALTAIVPEGLVPYVSVLFVLAVVT